MGHKCRRTSSWGSTMLDLFQHCEAAHDTRSGPACRVPLSRFRLRQNSERHTSLVQPVRNIVCDKNRHAGKDGPANRGCWGDARNCFVLYPDRGRGRAAGFTSVFWLGMAFLKKALEDPLLPRSLAGGRLWLSPGCAERSHNCEDRLEPTVVFSGPLPAVPDLLVWKVVSRPSRACRVAHIASPCAISLCLPALACHLSAGAMAVLA